MASRSDGEIGEGGEQSHCCHEIRGSPVRELSRHLGSCFCVAWVPEAYALSVDDSPRWGAGGFTLLPNLRLPSARSGRSVGRLIPTTSQAVTIANRYQHRFAPMRKRRHMCRNRRNGVAGADGIRQSPNVSRNRRVWFNGGASCLIRADGSDVAIERCPPNLVFRRLLHEGADAPRRCQISARALRPSESRIGPAGSFW